VEAAGVTELPILEESTSSFTAFDSAPRPLTGNLAEYRLELRDGTNWLLLRSEGIELTGDASLLSGLVCQPNPFGTATVITYNLRTAERCRLEIIAPTGHRIRSLIEGGGGEGEQQVVWDGRDDTGRQAAVGVYFAHFAGAGRSEVVKLVLLR
jgi:hypothetical protein